MACRRAVALTLGTLLALLAHPCLAPALSHAEEAVAGVPEGRAESTGGAAVEHLGCDPEATAGPGPTSPGGWRAAAVAAPPSAVLDTRGEPGDRRDRPPGPVPRAPLFLLHAALLA